MRLEYMNKRLRWYKKTSGKGEGERKNEGVRCGWKLHKNVFLFRRLIFMQLEIY